MHKLSLGLITFALLVSACASGGVGPTTAPTGAPTTAGGISSTNEPPAGTPAITEQPGVVVRASPTPAPKGQIVPSATEASSLGGPIVVTVEPGNGTPQGQGGSGVTVAPTPIPTLAGGLPPSELKFRVLAAYPGFFYCDPDQYPVAIADETKLVDQRFPDLQANAEEFNAIVAENHLTGTVFTSGQKLVIYQAHKKLAAIRFTLASAKYQFQLEIKDANGNGQLITGLIDGQGAITNQQSQSAVTTCPV